VNVCRPIRRSTFLNPLLDTLHRRPTRGENRFLRLYSSMSLITSYYHITRSVRLYGPFLSTDFTLKEANNLARAATFNGRPQARAKAKMDKYTILCLKGTVWRQI